MFGGLEQKIRSSLRKGAATLGFVTLSSLVSVGAQSSARAQMCTHPDTKGFCPPSAPQGYPGLRDLGLVTAGPVIIRLPGGFKYVGHIDSQHLHPIKIYGPGSSRPIVNPHIPRSAPGATGVAGMVLEGQVGHISSMAEHARMYGYYLGKTGSCKPTSPNTAVICPNYYPQMNEHLGRTQMYYNRTQGRP